jgi:hypothetical protein
MRLRSPSLRRRAATLAEAAISYSVVCLLTIGVIVFALGIFRYEELAGLAREGARWAAVHGGQYHQETGNALATPQTVYNTAILPRAVGLDTSKLSYTVTWDDPSEMPVFNDVNGNVVTNKVTVTLTYTWIPELYFSTMTLRSTSVMPVQY